MVGDERVRFCQSCRRHVYNFSALTSDSIADLIRAKEGKLCARFYRRRDGTMLTANCTVGRSRQRRRDFLGLSLGALGIFAAYLGIAATSDKAASNSTGLFGFLQRIEHQWRTWFGAVRRGPAMGSVAVMGEVCIMPSPTPPQNTTSAK